MINHWILVNKASHKGYHSFYRKLSKNSGNPSHSQQDLDLDISDLNSQDIFLPPEDDIKSPVTGKEIEQDENKIDSPKREVQFFALKSDALCAVSALGQIRRNVK